MGHGHACKVAVEGGDLMSLGLDSHSNSKCLCGIFITKDFLSTESSRNVHGDPMG